MTAPGRGIGGCAVVCAKANSPHVVVGARFSKQPGAGAQESSAHWVVLKQFRVGTSEDPGLFYIVPEFGVFARIVGGHNGGESGVIVEQARFAGHHVLFGTVVVEAVSGELREYLLREHERGLPKEDDVDVGVRLGSVVEMECGVE